MKIDLLRILEKLVDNTTSENLQCLLDVEYPIDTNLKLEFSYSESHLTIVIRIKNGVIISRYDTRDIKVTKNIQEKILNKKDEIIYDILIKKYDFLKEDIQFPQAPKELQS